MANYKLVNSDQLDNDLKSVANKIREKSQLSNLFTWPSGFIEGIDQCSSLNFTIVSGTSEPSSPTENMIWVNMTTKVADYYIGTDKPEKPVNGTVWIVTGENSGTSFSATKNGTIMIYPIRVERFASGVTSTGESFANWDEKESKIWQDGEWKTISAVWEGQLYTPGNQWEDVTGGWEKGGGDGMTLSFADDGMTLETTGGSNRKAHATTANAVDLSDFNTLRFKVNVTSGSSFVYGISDTKALSSYYPSFTANGSITSTGSKDVTLDISNISGEKYVAFGGDNTSAKVTEVRLER